MRAANAQAIRPKTPQAPTTLRIDANQKGEVRAEKIEGDHNVVDRCYFKGKNNLQPLVGNAIEAIASGVAPGRLTLEITEQALVAEISTIAALPLST